MESFLGRYRNLTILVGVLFLQVLGLAVQVKRSPDAENTRLIRIWAVDLITPFERGLLWAQNGSGNLWHNYFYLRGVRAENRQLKEQIEQMRLAQVRLTEDATQAHRLQSLLAFKEQFIARTVAAQVIGSSGSDLSQMIYIDKGSNDGIGRDFAVITAGGIVGKVLEVFPSVSKVLMINDQSSGAGVYLEKSRLQGVLRGTPNGELIVERVMSDEQVSAGDQVLTSGGDRIFPKGLPVGVVTKVSPGREMFFNIKVKPAADLSRLEEVLVVTEKQERPPAEADSGGRMRAADFLAQRLPSVPDKAPANAVTATPGNSANSGNVPNAPQQTPTSTAASGQPASGELPKKELLKPAAQKADSGNAANVTPNLSPGSTPNASKSANPPAKPAPTKPKGLNSVPTPQTAAPADDPH